MTGSYKPSFFTAGAFTTAGACLLFLVPLLLPPEVEKEWTQRTNSVRQRVDPSNLISMSKIGKRNSEFGNRYEETVKMMVDRKGTSKNSSRTGDIDTELTCSTEKRGDIDTKVTYSTEKGLNIKTEVTYSVEKGVDAETEVTYSTDIDINVEVTTAAKASNKPSLLFDTMYYSEKLWTNFSSVPVRETDL